MKAIWKLGVLTAALLTAACATPPAPAPDDDLAAITSPRLERFASDADFRAYLRDLRRIARARGEWWARENKGFDYSDANYSVAAPPPPPPPPAPPPPPPPPGSAPPAAVAAQPAPVDSITSSDTGSFPDSSLAEAVQDADGSITNTQTRGVDEGDIVKRSGRFLIVLQDGRLFTIDMRPRAAAGLAFIDRIDVYRNRGAGTWYDEMLVYQNRIVVTGYSYAQNATEISVFTLSDDGQLARESVYYMSSNDYYDIENYATRLVDDALVIYTPLDLTRVDPNAVDWPVVRRWVRGEGRNAVLAKPEALFRARDIYRPLQRTIRPTVHAISTCPLGAPGAGDELACTATAFIGPPEREFYISTEAAYLWVSDPQPRRRPAATACEPSSFADGNTATLFRAPLDGGAASAMHVRGRPRDQLGLASTADEFRALLVWDARTCLNEPHIDLKYFSAPLSAFSTEPSAADPARYTTAPGLRDGMFEQRFTDDYVIYGSRRDWSSYPPDAPVRGQVVALPVANPSQPTLIDAPHNIIRVERVGDNAVLTGYRNDEGLSVSLIDLSATPRLAATTVLPHRYESEGRSHAFNSRIDSEGDGLIGVPTVFSEANSGRWWFHSGASDVSFLSVQDGALRGLGELRVDEKATHPSYACEVSCVDWYGNSRPIFTDGRIFALVGTELIEGAVQAGEMQEVRRVNLSAPPPRD